MAARYLIGVNMQQGDLLVAHPIYAHPFEEEAVVLLTEVNAKTIT